MLNTFYVFSDALPNHVQRYKQMESGKSFEWVLGLNNYLYE